MRMFAAHTYVARRKKLQAEMKSGLLLFVGNDESSINFKDNCYPFRQDSTFLYFFGIDLPGLTAVIDLDEGREVIFGDDITVEDSIWTGSVPTIHELASQAGVGHVLPKSAIEKILRSASAKRVHYLPPFRPENELKISEWLSIRKQEISANASVAFIKAVINQRSFKSDEEVREIVRAVDVTADMHLAVMQGAKSGSMEYALAGVAQGVAIAAGGQLSFPVILTINGQILHNHYHGNMLEPGKMVLCDLGAETEMHYAGDLTRTFPVGPRFSEQQREIYHIVFETYCGAVSDLKPGVLFRDVHLRACRRMAEGLKDLGLMKGDLDEAVKQGAHALFFQCGLGHMMGLDVHDMEDLGEQYVGYTDELKKSTQFGLRSLRLGKALEKDFVLTVEPGIYFIPELIDLWRANKRHSEFINYSNLSKYTAFGGIRIEDDFLITEHGAKILGKSLPVSLRDIEDVRGSFKNG